MKGEIKVVEVGAIEIYEQDLEGKDTEVVKEKIPGINFEIQIQGATVALELDSIWTELIDKSGIKSSEDSDIAMKMMRGMRGEILQDIKRNIIRCVFTPKLTESTYEDLDPSDICSLFVKIHGLHVKGPKEKKN
jgi:hypothetical protein